MTKEEQLKEMDSMFNKEIDAIDRICKLLVKRYNGTEKDYLHIALAIRYNADFNSGYVNIAAEPTTEYSRKRK